MRRRTRVIIWLLVPFLISLLVLYWGIVRPFSIIRDLDRRYAAVRQGMSGDQVKELMGHGDRIVNGGPLPTAWWNDEPLAEDQSRRIRHAIQYSVDAFFMPVTFAFTFDQGDRLVGKHRYD